jgi:ornithine carbamoyltransferase
MKTQKIQKKDFLKLADLSLDEHQRLFARAIQLKTERKEGQVHTTLAGKTIGLIFEKPSTRTKLSFEAATLQLGGNVITLQAGDSQIARGEPTRDTARVASGYCDLLMLRTFADERLEEFAKFSKSPVINGLSDGAHPVQLLADLMTIIERLGSLNGRKVAWLGDGSSNMAYSWIEAAGIFGFELRICAPKAFRPNPDRFLGMPRVSIVESPRDAVSGCDVITTDVWTSMGQEKESAERLRVLAGYTLTRDLLDLGAANAIVLHCLPAHRGEEITDEVIEDPRSAIFDEAENRMHAQKALMELLLGKMPQA